MTLRLLLGRAGVGKTRRCLDEIFAGLRENPLGPPLVFIVPAQETFSMERELAQFGGSMRAQVYSFRRFAHRVLRETGGAALLPVSELGRRMMLKGVLLEEKGSLEMMGALQNRPGFLASLSELVGEVKTCRLSPEDLIGAAGREAGQLGMKLRDFSLVFHRINEKLADKYTDPDDYLNLLAGQIPGAALLEGCRVWVDGFNSFSPQEYEVIKALLQKSKELTLTLCLDEASTKRRLPENHPFVKPGETCHRLCRLARAAGAAVETVYLAPGVNWRFKDAPELAYLEKNFFTYPVHAYKERLNRIFLAAAVNTRAEVEGIARKVRRLMRDGGLRPRRIMVAVRDINVYFPLLQRVFEDYEIPFFIDHRQSVMHHPLVELLRSAAEVWQSGWTYDPVFRYLKTGLAPLSRDETDRLENYVLAAGIRGSKWYSEEPWRYVPGRSWLEEQPAEDLPPELAEMDAMRRRAVKELRAAQLKVRDAASGRPGRMTGRDWSRVLVELCLELGIPWRMDQWSRAAFDAGRPELTRQHLQVWRLVNGLLDELAEVLGHDRLTMAEWGAVLDAGFEALSLSMIPPGLDAVTIGSLDRSRPPRDVAALFIPGLSEGVLPAAIRKYGVFTERERELLADRLAAKELELPPGTRDSLYQEQFLVYRALTRTGGALYLSYPLGDDEGRAASPSMVIRRVRELFPWLEAELMPTDPPGGWADLDFMEHPAGLLPRLALRWREAAWGHQIHPAWWRLYNLLAAKAEWRPKMKLLVNSLSGRNTEAPLGEDLSLGLWSRGNRKQKYFTSSVSRLERFVRCPFAHFLAHGLQLEERAVYRLAPPDTGQLYHEALRIFVEKVTDAGAHWDQLDDEQVKGICTEIVDTLAPRLQGKILLSSARMHRQKDRLLERLNDTALAMTRQMRESNFRPAALEVYFGPQGKIPAEAGGITGPAPLGPELLLPSLEVELAGGVKLTLSGRIDRVDLGPGREGYYLRIIDYKSGPEKLELPRVLAGAQLQLLVYLQVALEYFAAVCARAGQIVEPAGAFYLRVQRPILNLSVPDVPLPQLEREWLKQFKLNGLLVDCGAELYRLLDQGLAPGCSSLLVPASLNKDGGISGRSAASVYTPGEFQWLLDALGQLLKIIGQDIAAGRVDIAPLKVGKAGACDFCVYGSVCRFDLWLPENRFRSLNLDAKELRRRVQYEVGRKGGACFDFYSLDR
ncbi:DNA helicase/exodeoxyribonuclease V, subunit B [Desulfotomaculum arcticum]|uniref:DNA helicase/exodeoxyribonuclease V, subunit B n=1 Tax=Desulfotruncus arcticus DSM 17038 TaxID=1121424 RepID=A0A1I2UCG6_9FIRM|nr:helicase-exonuclease AddAB subunit AddB [Desulfotruncus arcticus]SFG72526.1 DNA helicase/exodeoxyribonuclease V, subunit B [Desulfotomaculum arcticum] [Desulfotruncus arcticus DSM 17038]